MNDVITEPVSRTHVASRRPRTWLRLTWVLLGLAVLAAGLIGFHQFKAGMLRQITAHIQAQQPTVSTALAGLQSWQPVLTAVGSLRASNGADLAPEVGGVIDEVDFVSGRNVAAGALLLKLRLNDDEAKLAEMQATAELDAITYKRDLRQLQAKGVAQSTVDTDAGNLKVARAEVVAQQAVIDEKTIRAPFAGRLGVRQIDLGQYIAAGTTIVTLQALDPMFIDFYLPQQALGHIALGQGVSVSVDAFPGRSFAGEVSAINSKVDSTSRMLQVRASIANPNGVLLPGMFATATAADGPPAMRVTVPLAAVAYNPYGSLIYVIRTVNGVDSGMRITAHQQFVTTGDTRGDQVSILRGVAAGDSVVTAGQLKLHNDIAVAINNSLKVTDDAAPAPQDQ